jgi:outer membrane protein OmpA-like peptidoglycan-associated protein
MNRNWHRRAVGGLPILSAALLSAAGFFGQGALSSAAAQSSGVIVNYDALNALGAQPNTPGAAQPVAPDYAPVTPPAEAPTSALTVLGPDGRPVTPIKLRKPGSSSLSDNQVAAQTPPDEPTEIPAQVPMPEPTPQAPAAGENAGQTPEVPVVETPAPTAEAASAETPAPQETAQYGEQPAPEEPAEEVAEQPAPQEPAAEEPTEQPIEQQASQEQPAEAPEAPAAETPPAEEAAAAATAEQQPAEEAAAEAPPEPDNTQPAAPIPQGGIRIVFPTDLNEVPVEANAALDDLAAQMLADESVRIEIKCYASGTEDTESKARRKSLARCLSIRQHLFEKNVRTTRMDVRALGLKSEGQPADRVDIVPANS